MITYWLYVYAVVFLQNQIKRRHVSLLRGSVPGFKLVSAPQGDDGWSDESAAEELLKSFRLKQEQMYSQKVITPSQAEDLLKVDSPRRWTKVEALITRADGKPTVAPESDPRPALNINPVNDFDDVSDDALAADLI